MIYIPTPLPLIPKGSPVAADIIYEKEFTTVDSYYHDEDHIHDYHEIYLNLGGDVSFMVEDHLYSIHRGDAVFILPHQVHRCLFHSDCVHEHFCIWIRDLPEELLTERFQKNPHVILSEEDKELLISHFFGMYQARQKETAPWFQAAHHFFAILDLLCTGTRGDAAAQNLPVRFTEIVTYISRHFQEPTCSVNQLCDRFYISKSSLGRYFTAYFQTTPSLFIESRRFAEAKKLLLTGHSVQHTCFHCGFSDCSYFVMRFRKKFGLTPLQYQKKYT